MTHNLGEIVEWPAEDGNHYPAIVMENSDEGGTVGLLVFSRTPYFVGNVYLPGDAPVESSVPVDVSGVPGGNSDVNPVTVDPGLTGSQTVVVTEGETPIYDGVPPLEPDPTQSGSEDGSDPSSTSDTES